MSSETLLLILGAIASTISLGVAVTAQLAVRKASRDSRRTKRLSPSQNIAHLERQLWIDSLFSLLRTIIRGSTAVAMAFFIYTSLATFTDRSAAKAAIQLVAANSATSTLSYIVAGISIIALYLERRRRKTTIAIMARHIEELERQIARDGQVGAAST